MRRLSRQEGMSAVEVALTLGIFASIMAFTLTAVTSAWTTASGVEQRLQDLAEGREIVNNVAKDLRTAIPRLSGEPAFVVADDFSTEFHANLNPTIGPRWISLSVDGSGRLVQEIKDPVPNTGPNWQYPAGSGEIRYLGEGVANPPTRPIFVYYDGTGAQLTTPLSDTDRPRVEAVGIRLEIQTVPTSTAKPTTIVDRVRLANVIYGAACAC